MSAGQSAKGHDFLRTFRGKETNSPWKTPNEHLTSLQGTKFMSRRLQKIEQTKVLQSMITEITAALNIYLIESQYKCLIAVKTNDLNHPSNLG